MRDYERATRTASRCSAAIERKLRSVGGLSSSAAWPPPSTIRPAPPAATSSSSPSTRSPTAATASPASTATSSSSPARCPGDRVRAVVGKAKRAYAEARAVEILEPSPDRSRRAADHPGAPWQVLALRAPARGQGRAGRRRAAPHRPARGLRARADRARGGAVALPQQARVLVRHGPGRRRSCAASTRPAATTRSSRSTTACSPPSAATRRASRCSRGAASRGSRRGTGATQRGLLRNLVVREGRRTGELQVRLVTSPGRARRRRARRRRSTATACSGRRPRASARAPQGGETSALAGAARLREQLGDLRVPDLARGVLPDQHGDGRDPLRRRRRVRRPARPRARLRPLLRHRHDRALRSPAARARWSASRSSSPPSRTRSTTPAATRSRNASFFAGDIRLAMRELVEQAGRPDVCVIDPPRAGLSQKVVRRIVEAAPKRIVYVSCNPTTLAPNAAQLVEAGYRLVRVRPGRHVPADAAHRVRRAARGGTRRRGEPAAGLRRPAPSPRRSRDLCRRVQSARRTCRARRRSRGRRRR